MDDLADLAFFHVGNVVPMSKIFQGPRVAPVEMMLVQGAPPTAGAKVWVGRVKAGSWAVLRSFY